MAKGIFTHRPNSVYDDFPEAQYQFPKRYLNRARTFEGDWIAYYEPRRGGGRLGYNAIAKVQEIIPDPSAEDMFLAIIEAGSFLPLEVFVPFQDEIGFVESDLRKSDGSLNSGLMQWAVRPISEQDFFRILARGFPAESDLLPRSSTTEPVSPPPGVREEAEPFVFEAERERVEQLVTRAVRDRAFRQHVLSAYDSRCALTGLKFINGGGRAEVAAAHIRPVEHDGPDTVRNGLALSGTIHWMFDRGLIGLADDHEILVSRQVNNPGEVWRLVNQDRRVRLPNPLNLAPHPQYLTWHREHCFKH
jgi:putative restriction endonuclease